MFSAHAQPPPHRPANLPPSALSGGAAGSMNIGVAAAAGPYGRLPATGGPLPQTPGVGGGAPGLGQPTASAAGGSTSAAAVAAAAAAAQAAAAQAAQQQVGGGGTPVAGRYHDDFPALGAAGAASGSGGAVAGGQGPGLAGNGSMAAGNGAGAGNGAAGGPSPLGQNALQHHYHQLPPPSTQQPGQPQGANSVAAELANVAAGARSSMGTGPVPELVTQTPAQQILASPADRFGLLGLLSVIRMQDPDLSMLALGNDLQNLGLNMSSQDALYSSLVTPWSENNMLGAMQVEMDYQLPSCYNVQPPPSAQSKINSFSDETLFFIFYATPRDVMQEMAAQELYNRNWRYEKTLQLWLTKDAAHPEPTQKTPTFERGTYVFFDPVSWEKVTKTFVLMYDHLEEKSAHMAAAAAAAAQAQAQARIANGQQGGSGAQGAQQQQPLSGQQQQQPQTQQQVHQQAGAQPSGQGQGQQGQGSGATGQ